MSLYRLLQEVHRRPAPFEACDTTVLWSDEHISEQMLSFHLDPKIDLSSRNHAFIERSSDWIVDHFRLGAGSQVLDLGCGPGLYTNRLARSGAAVTGIDCSASSVAHARDEAKRTGLSVTHVRGRYPDDLPQERFDLILLVMCDYCAMSPTQRAVLLDAVVPRLTSDGALLFDAYTLNAFGAREESVEQAPNLMNGFWSPRPYFGFKSVFVLDDVQAVLDRYTLVEEDRTWMVSNWLQYFSPESLSAELEGHGLRVADLLGDVAGATFDSTSDELAVVARTAGT